MSSHSGPRPIRAAAFVALFSAMLAASTARAQLASDEVPRVRTVPRSEEIEDQLQSSRFHLGPIRVRPIFGLRDTGYDNNVFGSPDDPISDWRSTVSAGADLVLPLGRKMYLLGTANPEYTWYKKLTERRLLGGVYGGSVLGLFNRLSIETGGSTEKTIGPVSSELERAIPGRLTDTFARGELEIFRRLSVFGSAEQQRQRYDATAGDLLAALNVERIERDETYVRGGVRYALRSYFDVSLAAENGRTEFVTARESDNKTRAILIGVHYDRPRFFLNLSGGTRDVQPRGVLSTFPSFSTTTGSWYAAYELGASLAIDASGHRSIVYSLYALNPYFHETRNGLGLTLPLGRRIGIRAFSEAGDNDYPIRGAELIDRKDKVLIFGGGIAYRLYRKIVVTFVASQTRYDSNVDTYDRSVLRVATTLSLRGESFR